MLLALFRWKEAIRCCCSPCVSEAAWHVHKTDCICGDESHHGDTSQGLETPQQARVKSPAWSPDTQCLGIQSQ
jgi:hypothetical protein